MSGLQDVQEFVEENDVKFIRLAFVDLFGTLKNISIMPGMLDQALQGGISFDASAVKGFLDVDHSELYLRPDPRTLTLLPWRPQSGRVARMLCDVLTPSGELFGDYSRTILLDHIKKAQEQNCSFRFGPEYEFYLFKADEQGEMTLEPLDRAGYMDVAPLDKGENVRREICLMLEQLGIFPEASHHEQGPGQNEIDFHYTGSLRAADNAVTFKGAVRTIAAAHGLHATFMPKPILDESGNGLHINLSIEKDGVNIFDLKDGKLSEEAEWAMAGILQHIREMTLFLNPIPSSYQRLGKYEAPEMVNWSFGSRRKLIRIPARNTCAGRMELRSPDPAGNPYLCFALIIAAAMDGLNHHMSLETVLADGGDLPQSLEEAVKLAENSEFIRNNLPEGVLSQFLSEKKDVCARYSADPEKVNLLHIKTI